MPLPAPKTLRILGTARDSQSVGRVAKVLSELDGPIAADTGPAGECLVRSPLAVILVWSSETDLDVAVFREMNDWDRRRVSIHVLNTSEGPVLGFLTEIATSVVSFETEHQVKQWLSTSVLHMNLNQEPAPREGAALRSFKDALSMYCSALTTRLEKIEPVGSREMLDFDDVFLPLAVSPVRIDPAQAQEEFDLLNVALAPSRQRIFVIGVPGSGKSTLLDHTAFKLAEHQLSSGTDVLPLTIRAKDFVHSNHDSLTNYLRLVVKGTVRHNGRQVSSLLLDADEFGDTGTILMVDGADELKRDDRPRLRQLLRTFETEFPDATVVVSSRPSGYDQTLWGDYAAMTLCPLPRVSATEYVKRFAPITTRDRLLELLATSERLRELAQIPFMLSLMTSYDGEAGALPLRRGPLVRACVRSLLSRRPAPAGSSLTAIQLEDCLTTVGDRLFRLDSAGGHGEGELLFALQSYLAEQPGSLATSGTFSRDPSEKALALLDELIERTGLLQRDGEYIDFVHRSIWEYFVGVALESRPLSSLENVAVMPAWEEPIRLMVGLLNDEARANSSISTIWQRNPGLALRSASESPHDLREVVRELVRALPPGESADLVRDLRTLLLESAVKGTAERLVLDTLLVLLPESRACEAIWECIELLLLIEDRAEEAMSLLQSVFRFDEAADRRSVLESDPETGVRFVTMPNGQFDMGSDDPSRSVDERPCHPVEISSFAMSVTPVTNGARKYFPFDVGVIDDPRSPSVCHPMIGVTWYEAAVFALWFGCRLPTEAEWEYACRSGGADDALLFDEGSIPTFAWFAGNAQNTTHPVGLLRANSFGLFDMLGNVREWCSDWFSSKGFYEECFRQGVVADPIGPRHGSQKVLRGGCFDWNTANLVPSYKNSNLPNNRGFQNGVRLVSGLPRFVREIVDVHIDSGTREPNQ